MNSGLIIWHQSHYIEINQRTWTLSRCENIYDVALIRQESRYRTEDHAMPLLISIGIKLYNGITHYIYIYIYTGCG